MDTSTDAWWTRLVGGGSKDINIHGLTRYGDYMSPVNSDKIRVTRGPVERDEMQLGIAPWSDKYSARFRFGAASYATVATVD
jgi:hypothetical protein